MAEQPPAGPGPAGHATSMKESRIITEDKASIITVVDKFMPEMGARLGDNLFVGKTLGSGLQGGVYELTNTAGEVQDVVLKMAHPNAPLADLEREWLVGQLLHSLDNPKTAIRGFMGTGSGLRTEGGKFRGMLLERMNGKDVHHRLCDKAFRDINYIRNMLRDTFTALDQAQRLYGLHHSDLRMVNIMEHHPNPKQPEHIVFKIIDFGLSNFDSYYAAGLGDDYNSRDEVLVAEEGMVKLPKDTKVPFTERLYRRWWGKRGDVFHVVWSLQKYIDGRVWHKEDERDVRLLAATMHHILGVRINGWFGETGDDGKIEPPNVCCACILKNRSSHYFYRRLQVRSHSFIFPSMPGITGAEALTSPFFTHPHALVIESMRPSTLDRIVKQANVTITHQRQPDAPQLAEAPMPEERE